MEDTRTATVLPHPALQFDECDCSCHTTGAIHIMACCVPCPDCGKNIKPEAFERHRTHCRAIPVEFEQNVRRG